MSRFKYLLDETKSDDFSEVKLIGLFPFNTLIDSSATDLSIGKLGFLDDALAGLTAMSKKNYSVVLFVNQIKNKPLQYETFQSMNQTIENMVRNQGVKVAGLYWCPSTDRNDPYVVPNVGMFTKVTENQGIVWKDIPVLSTSDNDLKAAERAGAKGIKIGKGSTKWTQFETISDWVASV